MSTHIPCPCPGSPHPDGDTITLREKLDFRAGASIRWAIVLAKQAGEANSMAEVLAVLTEGYLLEGVESWTLIDAAGVAVPVTKDAIRQYLIGNQMAATLVGDAADKKYQDAILPLVLTLFESSTTESTSSRPTPTDELTSPKTGSTSEEESQSTPPKSPTLLRPYSTSITQTDVTAMTSELLAGVSS